MSHDILQDWGIFSKFLCCLNDWYTSYTSSLKISVCCLYCENISDQFSGTRNIAVGILYGSFWVSLSFYLLWQDTCKDHSFRHFFPPPPPLLPFLFLLLPYKLVSAGTTSSVHGILLNVISFCTTTSFTYLFPAE